MNPKLKRLKEAYAARVTELHAAAKAIEDAPDDITPEDLQSLTATFGEAETAADTAREEMELYERTEAARQVAIPAPVEDTPAGSDAHVTGEPLTYERGNDQSIFRDLYRLSVHGEGGAQDAAERLSAHRREMVVERAGRPGAQYDLSSTDSAGGYLVAPLYLQDEFVTLARAGRPFVNSIGVRPLPPNTDSINVPTMASGTASDFQSSDNSGVQETDATFGTLQAVVRTIAGMQDVSQQLIDRSVPGIDDIIFGDLVRDYLIRTDVMALNSSTANNLGALQVSNINAITYTDTTATLAELYAKLADGIQQISTGIYMHADAIWMHPRRWAFCLASADGSNRPLIVPNANQPQNAAGTQDQLAAEGSVGSIQGLPVFLDANIPTTLGTGTNEDRIIIAHRPSLYIWEDPAGPYLETFRDVGSGTMTVRFRLHNYVAQMQSRRPDAISVVSGTGLTTPSF